MMTGLDITFIFINLYQVPCVFSHPQTDCYWSTWQIAWKFYLSAEFLSYSKQKLLTFIEIHRHKDDEVLYKGDQESNTKTNKIKIRHIFSLILRCFHFVTEEIFYQTLLYSLPFSSIDVIV